MRSRSSTGEWSSIDTHTLAAVTAVEVFGDIIITEYQDCTIRMSEDKGKTWKELKAPSYIIDNVYFTNPTEGKATRYSMGMFSSTLEENVYDSAKTIGKNRRRPCGLHKGVTG